MRIVLMIFACVGMVFSGILFVLTAGIHTADSAEKLGVVGPVDVFVGVSESHGWAVSFAVFFVGMSILTSTGKDH